ncbi:MULTISPECIES: tRNA pseudouridine(55) synthase TruB [Limibacillus]|nr:tRNA pseudouridine(55) synthase TruB [Limibacillus halophilus]
MARKRKGDPVNGWLVLDKPLALTSTQAVSRIKRLFNAQKAGHGGTLDPLATGILPIALGEATKTVPYAMECGKRYRFKLRWGQATTSDDTEGSVTQESDNRPTKAEIEALLPRFLGEIEQTPPRFSAIKVAGERAYDLAREGEVFELKARRVEIFELSLVAMPDADHAVFEVACGKGTYMRALARDIGLAAGTFAHVTELRRLAVGSFTEERAISLDSLEAMGHSPAAFEQLLPIETALDDIPALALSEGEALSLRRGQPVSLLSRLHRERIASLELDEGEVVCALAGGKPVALARYEAGALSPVRVLNL